MTEFGDPRLPRRFWGKVRPEPTTGCWLWTAAADHHGYGRFGVRTKLVRLAHRHAYIVLVDPEIGSLEVCHRCDNPSCVNPEHLFAGSHTDNMRDMSRKGRHRLNNLPLRNALKTHCSRGHPFSPENTSIIGKGRRCLTCQAAAQRAYMERKRANGYPSR